MEKITETLFCMLRDRNYEIKCDHFENTITVVNDNLILIKIEEPKVGINSIKFISSSLDDYNVSHAIVLYSNAITAFAKNGLSTFTNENKTVEFFLYQELMYNVTKHSLVPQHTLLSDDQKKKILKTYKVTDKQVPCVLHTDPVSRYFNAKPGQMFKIIRDSDVSYKSIAYRVVV